MNFCIRTGLLAAATLAGALGVQSAAAVEPVTARPHPVGLRQLRYEDPTRQAWTGNRPRPVIGPLWYPAQPGTTEVDWDVAIFHAGRNAQGAAPAATPAKLPLVLLSHGTGGAAVGLAWLGESLAAQGYLVAAVNHHGNTAAEDAPVLQGFAIWWDRPRDLSVLLDRLLADPEWGPRIDTQRIGVAGFSLGGYAALATVGARLSAQQRDAHCASQAQSPLCRLPPEAKGTLADMQKLAATDARFRAALAGMDGDYRDMRIRAAFVMAPVFGPMLTPESLAAVKAPVHIVVGAADEQATPDDNARALAKAIARAELDVIPNAGHYVFLPQCNWRGMVFASEICVDPPGVKRQAVHARVAAQAIAFFGRSLAPGPSAR
jgi:predicted dienelactone hydrolase